jgi:hypothetical protein
MAVLMYKNKYLADEETEIQELQQPENTILQ